MIDFYHSWIYEQILNTNVFLWTIIVGVFAFNFLGPVLIWFVMNSKSMPFLKKFKKTETSQ